MLDKVYITQHCTALKLRAAQKYDIAPERCHIGHLMLQGLLQRPNAICQIDAATDKSESNLSVAQRSMRLASAMNKFGLVPGDVVIIMGYNHLDVAIPFYACHFNGHSVCTMDPSLLEADLQILVGNIKPKLVFCEQNCVEKIKSSYAINKMKGGIVVFGDIQNDLEAFIKQHGGTEVNYRPAEFDQAKTNAWLMLTSGTTGLPKVAMCPYETVLNGICYWWYPYTDKYNLLLTMATLQWISSYMFFTSGPLRNYTRLQCSTPLTPPVIINIIHKYRPDVTGWTPFLVNHFTVAAEKGLCDLSSFKQVMIAGAPIENTLLERFKKVCPGSTYIAYGMTELLVPIFQYDDTVPAGSVGYPIERYQYKLVDEDGNTVHKPFKSGELWIKGDDFFKGYLNNKEETDKILMPGGWLKTGDIFYRNDEDFYFFVERKTLLIRNVRNWIPPLALEKVIKQHPGVHDAAVVGVPDPNTMERAVAVIQRRNGDNVEPNEIFRMLKRSLSENHQLTGGIVFVESLPVTATGKINRSQLRQIALSSEEIMPSEKII